MIPRLLFILLVVTCSALVSSGTGTSNARTSARQDLAALITRPIPPRDLYALTDELKLRPPRPIPHVVQKTSPNYPVGHQDKFHVLSEDQNKYFTVQATIVAKTAHLYIYVQKGLKVDSTAAQNGANYFEKSIYPTDRATFGGEWRPGVDHDPHITCLVGDLRSGSVAGFYSAEDEYPHLVNRWSNQREMIYLNSAATLPGDRSFKVYMSHEFQHMIHWHMHPRDNAWLNEGMSMLAEYINHFPPDGEASAFTSRPTTQLNTWSLSDAATLAHYGGAYLYLHYLYERYGKTLIRDILADKTYTDFELIDHALRQAHIKTTARKIFTDWVIANWVNNRSIAGGQYGYKDASYKISAYESRTVPFNSHWSIPPWAAQYVVLDNLQRQKPFKLSFSAPTTVPLVGFDHASNSWWSNRGDVANTRLVRTVDLRSVRRATLHFRTAYDIEKNYDYAYVDVSADGGKTWDTLRGTDTTTSDPNGANLGNGYTGNSKGWLNESVDLSRYAGHVIKLRFEYVTDDEYNGQGMVIQGITIPEVKYRDNGTGWNAQGFVRIGANSLPSQWTVQIIATTDRGTTVTTLPVTAGQGSTTFDPARTGLKKLVVVTFGTAPKTSVQSQYTLSAATTG